MSDSWIVVIPADPKYQPSEYQKQKLQAELANLAPKAEEIAIEADGNDLRFFDCGENFEIVRCPACQKEINSETWGDWMSNDYGDGSGFDLSSRELPCCGATSTLNDLTYDLPQGFARFGVSAMNCDRLKLTATETQLLDAAIGARVRIIYRYI